MTDKYFNDANLKNDSSFKEFLSENPGHGYLKVRASAANQALPISGIRVRISKPIGNYNVIFFEGVTDSSGMINNITLPTPVYSPNDLLAPNSTSYELLATGSEQNVLQDFFLAMYNGVTLIQDINVIPPIVGGI